MSMYADYISELTQGQVLETDKGFITYVFSDEKTCYIKEIYTSRDYRDQNVASELADRVVHFALKQGCDRLLGSVVPSAKGSTASLKVLLAYGFELDSCSPDFILFKKGIA